MTSVYADGHPSEQALNGISQLVSVPSPMMISVRVVFWAGALKNKAKAVVKNRVGSHFCVTYRLMVNCLFCC